MKNLNIILFVFLLCGCQTVTGPVSGKKYTAVDGQIVNMPAYAKELREDYLRKNPDLNPTIKEAINQSGLVVGMTPDQVIASLGPADDKDFARQDGADFEIWYYRLYHSFTVSFLNNKVYTIQTSTY